MNDKTFPTFTVCSISFIKSGISDSNGDVWVLKAFISWLLFRWQILIPPYLYNTPYNKGILPSSCLRVEQKYSKTICCGCACVWNTCKSSTKKEKRRFNSLVLGKNFHISNESFHINLWHIPNTNSFAKSTWLRKVLVNWDFRFYKNSFQTGHFNCLGSKFILPGWRKKPSHGDGLVKVFRAFLL